MNITTEFCQEKHYAYMYILNEVIFGCFVTPWAQFSWSYPFPCCNTYIMSI
jgi:hypothetical protein